MALLLDTGAAYAWYDRDDDWHERIAEAIDAETGPLVLPAVVVPELDHLLAHTIGRQACLALYDDIVDRVYLLADLAEDRYARVRDLDRRFADIDLGFVDAAVATLAEQLDLPRVLTTDRRHFPVMAGEVALTVLP